MATPARGKVSIDTAECKGCGVCVDACPPKCLFLLPDTLPKESAFSLLKAKVLNSKLLEVDCQAIQKRMECLDRQREAAFAKAHAHAQEVQLTHSRWYRYLHLPSAMWSKGEPRGNGASNLLPDPSRQ